MRWHLLFLYIERKNKTPLIKPCRVSLMAQFSFVLWYYKACLLRWVCFKISSRLRKDEEWTQRGRGKQLSIAISRCVSLFVFWLPINCPLSFSCLPLRIIRVWDLFSSVKMQLFYPSIFFFFLQREIFFPNKFLVFQCCYKVCKSRRILTSKFTAVCRNAYSINTSLRS